MPVISLIATICGKWILHERQMKAALSFHIRLHQRKKKKLCEKGKWMATQKSSRQSLQSVLYSCRLKDVRAMEKTAVFRSARVLAVRSVILWILGPNHKPLFTIVNVALLHLSAFCSHCKYGLTMTNRDNSKLTLIAVDQSGCSRTEASWQCNWDKLLSWQFIL